MKQESNTKRRKLIALGIGAMAFFSFFKWGSPGKKKKTVKMLTQDGRLVEINEDILPSSRKKISDNELKSWVNQNQ
jgi:hypothetical protein